MMDKKLSNLKLKLLLKELNLLETEEEYNNEFTSHYRPIFMKEIENSGEELPVSSGNTNSENTKKDKKFEVTEEEEQKIKVIYRNIAKLCHPDKTSDSYLIGIYSECQKAYEKNDLLTLYKISQKLMIDVDLNENDIFLLQRIVNEKKQELSYLKMSFLWLWVHANTDEEKQNLILQFINQHKK
jgi:hypothetical protein